MVASKNRKGDEPANLGLNLFKKQVKPSFLEKWSQKKEFNDLKFCFDHVSGQNIWKKGRSIIKALEMVVSLS